MSTSQLPHNILEHLQRLGFCEADSWELINLIGALGNEINGDNAAAEARKMDEWLEWFEQNSFRFELLKEFAMRTEKFITNEAKPTIPLSAQISNLGMGASFPDLLDSLSLCHPELLEVFVQSLQQCQAQSQNIGHLAGGTSKAGKDAMITGAAITLGAAGVYFGYKYATRPTAVLNRRITKLEQELTDKVINEAHEIHSNVIPQIRDGISRDQWRAYLFASNKPETLVKMQNKDESEINALFMREAQKILKQQLAIGYGDHPEAPIKLVNFDDDQFNRLLLALTRQSYSSLKLLYASKQLDPNYAQQKKATREHLESTMKTFSNYGIIEKNAEITQEDVNNELEANLMDEAKRELGLKLKTELNKALENTDKYLENIAENRLDRDLKNLEAREEQEIEESVVSVLQNTAEFQIIIDDSP